jgi:hypothetical protein
MRPLGVAFSKTIETGTKSGPECAIACHFPSAPDESSAVSMAECARHFGNAYCTRSIPLHFDECPLDSALTGRRHLLQSWFQSNPTQENVKKFK